MVFNNFPENFLWGAAASACQIESNCDAGGKVPTVHDYYSRKYPEKAGFVSPDQSADFYNRYESDIALMKQLGLKSFRFSISWARIFSDIDSEVNQAGVDYYNNVINCLIDAGIEPLFDLFHCDLPMFVFEHGGVKNPDFVKWFSRYAKTCFELFGDRIKMWVTVNEPTINIMGAHAQAITGPFERDMKGALLASHNMLLAHYSAVKIYHSMNLGGKIGAVNYVQAVYPKSPDEKDMGAAERYRALQSGMWINTMMKGEYPKVLTDIPYIASIMPENYAKELADAFEPMDFLGINYYGRYEAEYVDDGKMFMNPYPSKTMAHDDYGFVCYPSGLFDAMMDIKQKYGDPVIYITENGTANHPVADLKADLEDDYRIVYTREHLRELSRCLKAGVDIRGYYHWCIMDTWEGYGCTGGYDYTFGLIQINRKTLERTPRKSFYYYQDIIKKNRVE